MARSHHSKPETQHHKLSGTGYKKHGSGGANWGSQDEDIREGIEVARGDDYAQHPAGGANHENEKIHISPLQSPSLTTVEKDAAKDKDLAPNASV